MYEIERRAVVDAERPPLVPDGQCIYVRDIEAVSFLFWGEHCIECAAPSCFASCDLYSARANGRCRRFIHGIVRNRAFRSLRGYGAEVSFKKWGKLESRGNTAVMSCRRLLLLERLLGWITPALDGFGALACRMTGDAEWRTLASHLFERLGRRSHPRRRKGGTPDAFLVEVFNPERVTRYLHVTMTIARQGASTRSALPAVALLPSFCQRLELPPGYSRHELPHAEFAAVTESGLAFDVALMPEGDDDPTLVFIAADFVRFGNQFGNHGAAASKSGSAAPPIKCVVWDLDNTLWRGILLEDENVSANRSAIELLRAFDRRGILASVASKNDVSLAVAKMKEFGIEEYMLFPQIGWSAKSEGIKAIAEKLNIGLDTFLFIDDNQFELDEVARALPMLTCINVYDIAKLWDHPRLQGSTTDEARCRRLLYREAMVREQEEYKFGEDFFGFLRSCEMTLRIIQYIPQYFDRVCELVQRTNQLNFSGRKYKREEIGPMLDDNRLGKWVLECSDKFGSYGVVGFGLASRCETELRIEDFMLSCRVQGRFVEQAFFNELARAGDRCDRIWVNFHETERNMPAKQVLSAIGFEPLAGASGMVLDSPLMRLACDFIAVECAPAAPSRIPQSEPV